MEPSARAACPVQGTGKDPSLLVGTRLVEVVASRLTVVDRCEREPVDVWLRDDVGAWTWITAGSDWCLAVAASPPPEAYDLGELGRIDVAPDRSSPFHRHLGEPVTAVRERFDPFTGRTGLLVLFPSGGVDCDTWNGDLRVRRQVLGAAAER
ncbi:hypothetical protein [Streptantibioticus cattleyicolor]|uniref:hypothetical protein n=1 Tax=Streptantibioticus cattleyicolor TaxID=29303 RepID=UPI000213D91A|nr:hypothetical protein [Streptantibioticus cattleyicolor]CCB71051.1 Predicted protein [Streptantibioticus cattleyicolor NRRL 8057 = DSM 46488]